MDLEGKQFSEEFSSKRKPELSDGVTNQGDDEHGSSNSYAGDGNAAPYQGSAGGSGKRIRSGWEPQNGVEAETAAGDATPMRKKSRWENDDSKFLKILGPMHLPDYIKHDNDPEVQTLKMQLSEIGTKLQVGQRPDDVVDGSISPSPEPIYDNQGVRINTREFRVNEQLTRKRLELISQLIQKNPSFKPPVDYKPPRPYKKLYIPVTEYPDYNFIGLIIGPRGNTQKRMEKETGAKIIIRGKGSVKESKNQKNRDVKFDFSESEDLHVFIEAETQQSVDAAVSMVEKLLVPVEGLNEHKRAQLRELAELNGTGKHDGFCRLHGGPGHGHSTSQTDAICHTSGDFGHPSIGCPWKRSAKRNRMVGEHCSSVPEHSRRGRRDSLVCQTRPGHSPAAPAAAVVASWGGSSVLVNSSGYNISSQASGFGSTSVPIHKYNGVDGANLYVGYLPRTVDCEQLMHLFSPFGRVLEAKVIKDRRTGLSKGYGFVMYADEVTAFCAATHMNGYRLDGRLLVVRLTARAPPTGAVGHGLSSGDTEQSTSLLLSAPNADPFAWYGPPIMKLPSSYSSCNNAGMLPSSGYVGAIDPFRRRQLSSSHGAHEIPNAYAENACAAWREFRPSW
ncbi:Branchpoint-bridging protein [Nymphaea thermarum]|nr:Branchpoint-bridging protein [Nymphaea thermarum]